MLGAAVALAPKKDQNSQLLAPHVHTVAPEPHSGHMPQCQTPVPPPLLAVSGQLSPPQSLEAIWDLREKPFIQGLFLPATVSKYFVSAKHC